MNPTNPLFKPRFITALNVRMKKLIPAKADYTARDMQTKIQAIAMTVLQDMGLKDWKALIVIKALPGGKAAIGCTFRKIDQDKKQKIWTPE